ncbi:MAG: FAD-dependent oxidoreductase [Desulfobacteraceae bacterium]|nr:FAD-dependent oxidoreductase [Desulfobacteraceae bacterium]
MRKHLVLVGGGHAHMVTLENIDQFIDKGYKVTVIAPSFHHYYSGMGPGMLGKTYIPEQIRFNTKEVVIRQGGVFVKDRVVSIDPEKKLVFTQSDNRFAYDVLSFNAGSYVPMESVCEDMENIYPVKPIEKLAKASEKLTELFKEKSCIVSVVGGGPSSAEVAGNVWQLARLAKGHQPEIKIFAGKKFMGRFAEPIRQRVLGLFSKRGIEVIEAGYVKTVAKDKIILETGEAFDTDFTFMALGVKPSSIFEKSGLPMGPDKGLLVNKYLQSVAYPGIFGGGDCIYFENQPLDKVGVYAVRENPVLFHNLMASLDGRELESFDPGPDYLLIFNLGGKTGVLRKNRFIFGGRLAFMIKDYIDQKFIRRFQTF